MKLFSATTFREPETPGEPVSAEPVELVVVDESAPAGNERIRHDSMDVCQKASS